MGNHPYAGGRSGGRWGERDVDGTASTRTLNSSSVRSRFFRQGTASTGMVGAGNVEANTMAGLGSPRRSSCFMNSHMIQLPAEWPNSPTGKVDCASSAATASADVRVGAREGVNVLSGQGCRPRTMQGTWKAIVPLLRPPLRNTALVALLQPVPTSCVTSCRCSARGWY